MDDQNEIWRPVVGHEADYEVSNMGRIRRISRARRAVPGSIIVAVPNDKGYLYVGLHRDGRQRTVAVHKIVAIAFMNPPLNARWEINHIDGVKANCRLENLEFSTRLANIRHAWAMGLMPRGEKRGHAKLSDDQVREIRRRHGVGGVSKTALAREIGVSFHTIFDVLAGRTWRHVQDAPATLTE